MKLHITQSGTPGQPTLIFLHGLAMGQWMWHDQIQAFQDYHCINVDLPGHGGSHAVPWRSFQQTADSVAEIIAEHATNQRAHIVGMSLGAVVGLHLLIRHPQRVQRAVLSGGIAETPRPVWLYRLQTHIMGALLRTSLGVSLFARMLHIPPDGMAVFREYIAAMPGDLFRRVGDEICDFALPLETGAITIPALVVTGDKDLPVNHRSTRTLAEVMPQARGFYAPNTHHGWNGECPALFNQMLRAWVEEEQLPAALIPVG